MNLQRAVSLARHALKTKDPADIHVAADAMEDLDDIRAAAIHNHIHCCERGIGILRFLVCYKQVITRENKHRFLFVPNENLSSEKWPCLQQ